MRPLRMPSLRPLIAPSLCLIALCVVAGGPRPPAALAQAPAQPPVVTVDLFGDSLQFRTLPFTLVTAELAGKDGRKAEGVGVGDAQGVASIQFFVGDARIQPGDSITLSRANDKPLHVTVPELAATVAALPEVSGVAPPGAKVHLSLTAQGTSSVAVERDLTADGQGEFEADLGPTFSAEGPPVTGSLTYDAPDGSRFNLSLATLQADLTLGAPVLRGQATAGWSIGATVTGPDGVPHPIDEVEAGAGGGYVLPLGALGRLIQVGDTVDLLATGGAQGVTWTMANLATVEDVSVELDASADRARGTAPPGSAMVVLAEDMDGRSERFTTAVDSGGKFDLGLAPRVDLGPGWRVRAGYEQMPGMRIGRLAVLPRVRVGVGLPISQGRAEPGRVLTATLRVASGDIKAMTQAAVDDQGEYQLFFFGAPGGEPSAGDSLELEFSGATGDPQVLRVPELSALADIDGDAVTGRAPAGAAVRVHVQSAQGAPWFGAVADASGDYRVPTGPGLDLARPSYGQVMVAGGGNAEFTTSWAASQLNATLGNSIQSNFLFGNGPAGKRVSAELRSAGGKVVGTGEGQVFGGGGFFGPGGAGAGPQFFMQLADVTGTPVEMQAGDVLHVVVGDEVIDLTVPPMDSVVLVQSDRITGRTAPDRRVTIRLADSPLYFDMEVQTRSDAAGNFSQDLSGKRNIRHGDFIQLEVDVGGHNISDVFVAPGLLLDLDQAILLGSIAPDLEVDVRLKRAGADLARVPSDTDATGAFFVQFADAQGTPLRLQAGDEVQVIASDPTQEPLSLTVPDLSLSWDMTADTVGGRAPATGQLTLFAGLAYPMANTLGISQGWPTVQPAGTFVSEFVPSIDVRPGSRFFALYRPPQGHYVLRTRTVPILNAQHSGPNACGFGTPFEAVSLALESGGSPVASSTAQPSGYDGFFSRLLRDPAGIAVKTAAAQRERAELGGPTAQIDLPVLEFDVSWDAGQVQGKGPAGDTYYVQPAVPCPGQRPGGVLNIGSAFAFSDQTAADGSFSTFLPAGNAPGSGVEIALYAPGGHRYFRQAYRALAQVYIHTDQVLGRANALDAATLTLRGAAGAERSRATALANGNGFFGVRFADAGGAPARIEAGDRVLLETPGQTAEIVVEDLSFDWSAGAPIFGNAPADRPLRLLLRLESGQTFAIDRRTNASGRYSFTADDVPLRGGWTLADVAAVRVELTTPNGHLIVDQTPSWTAPPAQSRPRIFLPAIYSAAPARGLAAAARDVPVRMARPRVDVTAQDLWPIVDQRQQHWPMQAWRRHAGRQSGGDPWPGLSSPVQPSSE